MQTRSLPAVIAALAAALCFAWVVIDRWGVCFWLGMIATVPAVLWFGRQAGMDHTRCVLFVVGSLMTLMLIDLIVVAPILAGGYFSHDTTPYSWGSTTLGCLLLAAVFATEPVTSRRTVPAESDPETGQDVLGLNGPLRN